VLLLGVGRAVRWDDMLRNRRELIAAGSWELVFGVALAFALAAARDVRLSIRCLHR